MKRIYNGEFEPTSLMCSRCFEYFPKNLLIKTDIREEGGRSRKYCKKCYDKTFKELIKNGNRKNE